MFFKFLDDVNLPKKKRKSELIPESILGGLHRLKNVYGIQNGLLWPVYTVFSDLVCANRALN